MSDLVPSEDIVFDGTGGVDRFIRAVRKAAFNFGKHDDDAWCATFASTCLEGAALDFYEGLGDHTRNSWRLLLNALLTRFRPVSQSSIALMPSPAAAAGPYENPFTPTSPRSFLSPEVENVPKVGVLRVIDANFFTLGYLSTLRNREGGFYLVHKDTSKIMRLWLRKLDYYQLFARSQESELPLNAILREGTGFLSYNNIGSCGLDLKNDAAWTHSNIWMSCKDGTLDCSWPNPDRTRWLLQPALNVTTGELRLFPNFGSINTHLFQRVRLAFEPVNSG